MVVFLTFSIFFSDLYNGKQNDILNLENTYNTKYKQSFVNIFFLMISFLHGVVMALELHGKCG